MLGMNTFITLNGQSKMLSKFFCLHPLIGTQLRPHQKMSLLSELWLIQELTPGLDIENRGLQCSTTVGHPYHIHPPDSGAVTEEEAQKSYKSNRSR